MPTDALMHMRASAGHNADLFEKRQVSIRNRQGPVGSTELTYDARDTNWVMHVETLCLQAKINARLQNANLKYVIGTIR